MIDLNDYLRTRVAAKILKVHPNTLRKWEVKGKLKAIRHPLHGYRLYIKKDIEEMMNALEGALQK